MSKSSKNAQSVNRLDELGAASTAATADTLAKRDANGRLKAADGVDPDDVATISQIGGDVVYKGSMQPDSLPSGWTRLANVGNQFRLEHNLNKTETEIMVSAYAPDRDTTAVAVQHVDNNTLGFTVYNLQTGGTFGSDTIVFRVEEL